MNQLQFRVVLVGVLVGLFGGTFETVLKTKQAIAEIINIDTCDPDKVQFGNGHLIICVPRTSTQGRGGNPPPNPNDPGPDPGPGPDDDGDGIDMDCDVCTSDYETCMTSTNRSRDLCRSTASAAAAYRCDIANRGVHTSTPWGVSIGDLWGGRKTGEPIWDRRDWSWQCRNITLPLVDPVRVCDGLGITACQDAWAASHPGVAVTNGSGATANAGLALGIPPVVATVGGSGTTSSSSTATWTAQTGWVTACDALHSVLASQCSVEAGTCYKKERCWDQIP